MSRIFVCPLDSIDEVIEREHPSHLLSLLGPDYMIEHYDGFESARHLRISVNDIAQMMPDQVEPQPIHAEDVLAFADTWDRTHPMLIHCWAGISRSTASMFMILCKLNPDIRELDILRAMRKQARHVAPNRLLVAHADALLGRDGRMMDALDAVGPALPAGVGFVFSLPSDFSELEKA